jgi:hypothetical protein
MDLIWKLSFPLVHLFSKSCNKKVIVPLSSKIATFHNRNYPFPFPHPGYALIRIYLAKHLLLHGKAF